MNRVCATQTRLMFALGTGRFQPKSTWSPLCLFTNIENVDRHYLLGSTRALSRNRPNAVRAFEAGFAPFCNGDRSYVRPRGELHRV